MIAGETEAILNRYQDDYDEFFGLFKKKKKKELTPEQEKERTEKREKFWSGVQRTVKDIAALGQVTKGQPQQMVATLEMPPPAPGYIPSDLSFRMEEDEKDEDDKKKGFFTPQVVGGIVLVIGVIGLGIYTYKSLKAKQSNAHPNT